MRNDKRASLIIIEICAFTLPVFSNTGEQLKLEPNHPTLIELIDKYSQALDSVQSMISSYETSSISSAFFPPFNMDYRNEKLYSQGQRRTDGKGRIYNQRYIIGDI